MSVVDDAIVSVVPAFFDGAGSPIFVGVGVRILLAAIPQDTFHRGASIGAQFFEHKSTPIVGIELAIQTVGTPAELGNVMAHFVRNNGNCSPIGA